MILSSFTPTPEFWAICTLIATSLGKTIYDVVKRYQDRQEKETLRKAVLEDREEVRKDLAAQAELLKQGFETINDNGVIRLKAIISSNATTRDFTKKALNAANNVTEKSNVAIEIATKALERVSGEPLQVEVMNKETHPIPVKQDENT